MERGLYVQQVNAGQLYGSPWSEWGVMGIYVQPVKRRRGTRLYTTRRALPGLCVEVFPRVPGCVT